MALSLGITAASTGLRFLAENVCQTGVFSCQYLTELNADGTKPPSGSSLDTCAPYNEDYISPYHNYYLLIFTVFFAAVMAFAIGGNDGANAWATAIHSFAITLRPACLLAGFFEILGASTLGYGVSTSIQKGISNFKDPDCFACGYCNSSMTLYYVGMMAALIGASTFLVLATWFRMPVSTTHAIVSAVAGMTVTYTGFSCIEWGMENLGGIIASWFISPFLSGVVCLFIYYSTYYFIFAASSPRKRAFIALPFIYFLVVFVIVFLAFNKSPATKKKAKWIGAVIGLSAGGVVAVIIIVFLLPYLKRNLPSVNEKNKLDMAHLMSEAADFQEKNTPQAGRDRTSSAHTKSETPEGISVDLTKTAVAAGEAVHDPHLSFVSDTPLRASLQVVNEYEALSTEQEDAMWMFKFVLILVACLQSFAHGSNDTANATAALSAVVNGFSNGIDDCTNPEAPWWIMTSAGFILAVGILVWGYRVMETMGRNIAIVNFHRAFCTEFASSCTVVIASLLNFPVSSTHCQVGAVIFVSVASLGWKRVQWSLVGTVALTWVTTLPFAALVSALFAYLFKFAFDA